MVREIDGETLVYDRSRDAASCLNEIAARVWRECDGETSVADDRRRAGRGRARRLAGAASTDESATADRSHRDSPDLSAAKSHREIGARLGLGAAAFVTSIVAPMPAQAASCVERWASLALLCLRACSVPAVLI